MSTIEINADLTDINYLLLGQKALDQWEFVKQQDDRCNNCDRSDFTSDLKNSELKYDPNDPYWEWLKKHNESIVKKVRGFYYEDVYVVIAEDEDVEEAIEKFKKAIIEAKMEETLERIEEREDAIYDEKMKEWKHEGWKFEDQPMHPNGWFWYSKDDCLEKQKTCSERFDCNAYSNDECDPDSCREFEITKY